MSHLVTINTKIHDPVAITVTCQRLGLPAAVHGTTKLFSDEVTGLIVQLPGWTYPAVIDTLSGEIRYDNYGGQWGDQQHLHKFIQYYDTSR